MPYPAQQVALQEYIDAVHESLNRVKRLTDQIRQMVPGWRLAPIVSALQAARGVSLIVAVTVLAELGDLSRFAKPSQLMAHLGLVPSEHSSGESVKRRGITKTGNSHVRKALLKLPGHTGCRLGSVVCCSNASRVCLIRSARSHGRPSFDYVPATKDWWLRARPSKRWSPPLPVN